MNAFAWLFALAGVVNVEDGLEDVKERRLMGVYGVAGDTGERAWL